MHHAYRVHTRGTYMLAERKPKKQTTLSLAKAASRMTEIVQNALDEFPPAEREIRLKAYLSGTSGRASSAESPSTGNGSRRTSGSQGLSRPR